MGHSGKPRSYFESVVVTYVGDDCLIWPFYRDKDGYAGPLLINGKQKRINRLLCELVNGPPPTATSEAAHNCNNGRLGCVSKTPSPLD